METFEGQVDWEILKAFSGILSIIAVIVASLVAVCYLWLDRHKSRNLMPLFWYSIGYRIRPDTLLFYPNFFSFFLYLLTFCFDVVIKLVLLLWSRKTHASKKIKKPKKYSFRVVELFSKHQWSSNNWLVFRNFCSLSVSCSCLAKFIFTSNDQLSRLMFTGYMFCWLDLL